MSIVEYFNSVTKEARKLLITTLIEYIRCLIQQLFYERQNIWLVSTSTHSKYAKEIISLECEKARRYRVNPINCYRFHVKDGGLDGIVSLNTLECSCRQFQCLEILCSHAIAAAREQNINSFTLCSRFYSVKSFVLAYAESISPLGHVIEWKKPPEYANVKIL
ncbi:uncharacterized protein LOC120088915 [Benincasa hispida]|uniref:uncharacterized protein LOC120088915 n=1 Tax=Benincasa hispida TaxID=102211 RepID=UPI0019011E60|nr:uncharacterized protein LOC120088915 [Benincasa hispida]